MRNLFLAAKKFAIDKEATDISVDDIKQALNGLEFLDNDAKRLIYDYFDVAPTLKNIISKEDVAKAQKHEIIPFNEDVKKFKSYMEEQGFTIASTISKIFIEKKNNIQKIKENILKLKESLKGQVFGQDQAIESICDKIVESSYNIVSDKPKAIYFFLGPPATGKTMLSKLIVDALDNYQSFKIFDMTQYSSARDGFALFGLEEGYSDAKEGKLTQFVKANPKSVIVFDEIEKTHPDVLANFLMLLSSGKAEDGFSGETIDFTQTIVIFTSNLGSELYNNHNFVAMMKENLLEANSTIIEAIGREERIIEGNPRKVLSPELLSRLSQGNIVLFNKLPFDALLNIAKTKVLEVHENFEKEFGIEVEYSSYNDILALLLLSFSPQMDVRKIKSKLPSVLFDLVTDYIIMNDVMISKVVFQIDEMSKKMLSEELFSVDADKQLQFIHSAFRKNETFRHEIVTSLHGSVLTIEFTNMQRKKLAKSIDFSGKDGLVFQVPDISFNDVAGHHVAKKRLSEVIHILKDPTKLSRFDVKVPKGMLLYGVPGTGKTMLAKAFANEADLPFIETTGSEILDIDLMQKIFKKAREYAPSIIFIDEIEVIGDRKTQGYTVVINQLLKELSGFSQNPDESVFVIAATNFKERIDEAVIRSGRIDLHIEIDALDREAREFFINKLLQKPTTGEFDKEKILTYTAGMTGADLQKVARESSLYVFRNNLDAITQEIVIEQINTIKYGSRINDASLDKVMESTAVHEAGHAIISRVLMPQVKIEQITVIPRADALGFVSYDRDKSYTNLTREDIKNKICVAFAGRESQLKVYGEEGFDSGASNDLDMAMQYAHYAISTLGMGEKSGYINVSNLGDSKLFQNSIESEVKEWLREAQDKTKHLVQEHWNKITKLSQLLQEKEVVHEKELLELMK